MQRQSGHQQAVDSLDYRLFPTPDRMKDLTASSESRKTPNLPEDVEGRDVTSTESSQANSLPGTGNTKNEDQTPLLCESTRDSLARKPYAGTVKSSAFVGVAIGTALAVTLVILRNPDAWVVDVALLGGALTVATIRMIRIILNYLFYN